MSDHEMLCDLCHAFTQDIAACTFPTERWADRIDEQLPKGARKYGYWGHEGQWRAFRHGTVGEMTLRAASGCNLCWLMLKEWKNEFNLAPDGDGRPQEEPYSAEEEAAFAPLRAWICVQMGPLMRAASFELYIRSSKAQTRFELFSLDGQERTAGSVPLRRPLSSRVGDETGLALARDWISACLASHGGCASTQERVAQPELPTRVIDVGPEDGSQEPFLFVSDAARAAYATLSHCWGTKDRPVTQKANLEAHRKSLSLDTLPLTFKHAVLVTRALGLRYLWVDCYCIIQDSPEDWRAESLRMAEVYRNAQVCISATDAEDSFAGLFSDRPQKWQVRPVVVSTRDPNGASNRIGVRLKLPTVEEVLDESTVSGRAWILQERLLSRAVLHFTRSYLVYECGESTSDEATYGHKTPAAAIRSGTARNFVPFPKGRFELGELWCELVKDYTARALTYDTDKIPAVSGLANQLAELSGSTFVAGLWREDLHRGLLWHHLSLISGDVYEPLERPKEYLAPSWSWASVKGPVYYDWADEYPKTFRYRSKTDMEVLEIISPGLGEATAKPSEGVLKVRGQLKAMRYQRSGPMAEPGAGYLTPAERSHAVRVRKPGPSPMSNVWASLIAQADLSPEARARAESQMSSGALERAFGPRTGRVEIACNMDFDWEKSRACYCLRVTDWTTTDGNGEPQAYPHHLSYCLVLQRVDQAGSIEHRADAWTFERIGVAADEPQAIHDFFGDTPMSVITIR